MTVKIECVKGDIVKQEDMMAVVNAANAQLKPGSGVAGAIHKAAGPELEEACRSMAPIQTGEAIITYAYDLPNEYVIHCLGPIYGVDEPGDELLKKCYENALKLAEDHDVDTIAFPAISIGAFRFPVEQATEIAINTVKGMVDELSVIKTIRFVVFSDKVLKVYESFLKKDE
jgi:O-acetyl-ADP-ribose deacetylase (regulator of RNase III)